MASSVIELSWVFNINKFIVNAFCENKIIRRHVDVIALFVNKQIRIPHSYQSTIRDNKITCTDTTDTTDKTQ